MKSEGPTLQIGDAQAVSKTELLVIERDDFEGAASQGSRTSSSSTCPTPTRRASSASATGVLDLMRVRDPFNIGKLGDPFTYPIQSLETIVPVSEDQLFVVNDNNFPDSNGRIPGKSRTTSRRSSSTFREAGTTNACRQSRWGGGPRRHLPAFALELGRASPPSNAVVWER